MISIALLRGVNVGGHHSLRMANLVEWLQDTGLERVETYIQSGNVIVEHSPRLDVARVVHETIEHHTNLDVPVVVRTIDEFAAVVTNNPFSEVDVTQLHVSFLRTDPAPDALAHAARADWRPEEFVVNAREVYLHLPHGMGRSVMVPRLSFLATATTRNWNTVLELVRRAGA